MSKKAVDTILEINGYKLETNDVIYEVVPKFDADAPDGLKRLKTSKLLTHSSINTHTVGFDKRVGLWDTGLYAESPMYQGLPQDKREQIESKVRELIVIPYENTFGKDPKTGKSRLDPTDPESEFWNRTNDTSFKIELYKGRIFNTNDPKDLLQLFIAISSQVLAPKELEDTHEYNTAQFAVENKEKVKDAQQETDMLDVKTLGTFSKLLSSKKKLTLVLNYVGVSTPAVFNESVITSQFKRWTESKENSHQNKNLFLEAAEKAEKAEGYKELTYYKELQNLYRKGVIKKEYENFLLDGEVIGTSNFKNVAANAIKDKAVETVILQNIKE